MKMKKFILRSVMLWLFPIAYFWIFKGNAMLYSIVFWHGWYNVFAVVVSFLIGKHDYFGKFKWITPLVIGLINAATYPATFGLSNDIRNGVFDSIGIDIRYVINYAILSIVGLIVGVVLCYLEKRDVKINNYILLSVIAWIFPIAKFLMLNETMDAMFYAMIFLFIWYPVLSVVFSFLVGKCDCVRFKWLAPLIICIINVGAYPLMIGLTNLIKADNNSLFNISNMLIHVIFVAIGFLGGILVRYLCNRRKVEE